MTMGQRRFDGRVAVITGAGRGLGRAHALLLASLGAKVVVNDIGAAMSGEGRDESPARDVVAEIAAARGEAVACLETVSTPEGGKAIVEAALDAFGRIDILIHNAGNVRYGRLAEIPYEDFRAVLDVHLLGAFHVVRPAFERMCNAGYGRIVLTGSIGGIYSTAGVVNYAISKSGMIGLNNIAAIEGAEHGVKSNIILPGSITRIAERYDTSSYPPMGPEMVSPMVGYLCHEDCAVTGEMYVSIAGRMARAFISETEGVYRPQWTIDDVADNLDAIRDPADAWALHPAEGAYAEHIARSFARAGRGERPRLRDGSQLE
jgi:NAD(P)-dependent dehydrogenase (short-subunit alcohol dehydrogenase family)